MFAFACNRGEGDAEEKETPRGAASAEENGDDGEEARETPRRGVCRGMKEAGEHSRKGRRKRRNRPAAGSTMALACTRLCLLFAESLECGQGGYHVLYRKGVCTRAAVTLLYPSSLSLSLSSVPSADRLSPRGPRTNNCPPVNSRYDTREVGALHLFLRRQSAIVEVASL